MKVGEPGPAPSCFSYSSVAWSPDGNIILAAGYPRGNFAPGEIQYERILAVSPDKKTANLLEYWPGNPGAFLWSPDGKGFVFFFIRNHKLPESGGWFIDDHEQRPRIATLYHINRCGRKLPRGHFLVGPVGILSAAG